jgi:4-hydroxybenzoate polyprenyltransferase
MRLLVFSNVYIALAGLLLTRQTYLQLGLAPGWLLPVFVFASTLFIYTLDRISEISGDEDVVEPSSRHRWVRRHGESLAWVAVASVCVSGTIVCSLPIRTWWVLVPLALASLAYSLPLAWGRRGPYRLKDVAGLKIFLIAIVWAGATALLPAIVSLGEVAPWEIAVVTIERALYVFALTIPFDIRDLERDRAADIQTLPMYLGVESARRLAVGTMVLFALVSGWHYGWSWESWTPPIVVSALITGVALVAERREYGELYYVGVLDGMMLLQWACVAVWSMI